MLPELRLNDDIRLPRSAGSDDEPIYDHVASDDDYYNIPETPPEETRLNSTLPRLRSSGSGVTSLQSSPAKSNASSNSVLTGKRNETLTGHSSEYYALKQQLECSEHRVQGLIDSNDDMRSEISRLSTMVNKLVNENHELRSSGNSFVENEYATPQSVMKPTPPIRSSTTSVTSSSFDRRPIPPTGTGPTSLPAYHSPRLGALTPSYPSYLIEDEGKNSSSLPAMGQPETYFASSSSLPTQEEVVRRTEAITRCIQELLVSAKEEKFDAFIPCSERIVRAVTDMVSLFPETEDCDEDAPWGRSPLGLSLADLMAAAHHFETECRILIARSQKEPLHQGFVTQQVIQCAFDIAKSTKQLVAMFQ